MLNEYEIKEFLEKLGEAFRGSQSQYRPDYTSQLISLNSTLDGIESAVQALSGMLTTVGQNLLETAAIRVLQRENAHVMEENAKLTLRQRQLMLLMQDLGSTCLGCKKAKWTPHAATCEWATAFNEVFEGILKDATPVSAGQDQAAE